MGISSVLVVCVEDVGSVWLRELEDLESPLLRPQCHLSDPEQIATLLSSSISSSF